MKEHAMGNRLTFVLMTVVAIIVSTSPYAAEIHVSPRGQDDNPGTNAASVATLRAAQTIARQYIAEGLQEPVHVVIGEGTYYLNAPLKLTSEDSGTAECPVTWRAAQGEKVLLSGGVRITRHLAEWLADWSVPVPGVRNGWNFRQLFVNGKRAIRARFPNADQANPFLYATDGGTDHAIIDPKLVKPAASPGRPDQRRCPTGSSSISGTP